jgi:hypothetical protein
MFNGDVIPPPILVEPQFMPHYYQPPERTLGAAVASMVLGIISGGIYLVGFVLFWVFVEIFYYSDIEWFVCLSTPIAGFTLGLIGLILAVNSIKKINRSQGALGGKGFAITGLVLSIIGLVVSVISFILAVYVVYQIFLYTGYQLF